MEEEDLARARFLPVTVSMRVGLAEASTVDLPPLTWFWFLSMVVMMKLKMMHGCDEVDILYSSPWPSSCELIDGGCD